MQDKEDLHNNGRIRKLGRGRVAHQFSWALTRDKGVGAERVISFCHAYQDIKRIVKGEEQKDVTNASRLYRCFDTTAILACSLHFESLLFNVESKRGFSWKDYAALTKDWCSRVHLSYGRNKKRALVWIDWHSGDRLIINYRSSECVNRQKSDIAVE